MAERERDELTPTEAVKKIVAWMNVQTELISLFSDVIDKAQDSLQSMNELILTLPKGVVKEIAEEAGKGLPVNPSAYGEAARVELGGVEVMRHSKGSYEVKVDDTISEIGPTRVYYIAREIDMRRWYSNPAAGPPPSLWPNPPSEWAMEMARACLKGAGFTPGMGGGYVVPYPLPRPRVVLVEGGAEIQIHPRQKTISLDEATQLTHDLYEKIGEAREDGIWEPPEILSKMGDVDLAKYLVGMWFKNGPWASTAEGWRREEVKGGN